MYREGFRKYLEEAIGRNNAAVAFSAFGEAPSVSVRLNPFKRMRGEDYAGHFGCECREVPWSRHGLILSQRPNFTLDPCFHAGAYYVQDSSSMFVGEFFRKVLGQFYGPEFAREGKRPIRVLDLCAAPGGKSTDIAASLREVYGDGFILVANEVMKNRASVLADNIALWGEPNVVVTSADPAAFAGLKGYFDIIVADVPCSGEGMFRKDEGAVEQWSEDNVSLCAARQRRIMADVWDALAPGGMLLYSTCTFNRYENSDNVRWIERELDAEVWSPADKYEGVLEVECGLSLVPGFVSGEGQYCCGLLKSPGADAALRLPKEGRERPLKLKTDLQGLFKVKMNLRLKGDLIVAVPQNIAAEVDLVSSVLRPLAAGCAVGEIKGDALVPSADLALCNVLSDNAFPSVEVDLQTALAFLHRDTLCLPDAPKGYLKLYHGGLGLGFVKNLGSRCNNLHPQGRRIRMDIK